MSQESISGRITSIESFGSVDGPGLRYIIFLAGCNMRCKYCHNPETWPCTAGKLTTAEDVVKKAMRYKPYWKKGGGITVSGGEPLMQPEFVTEIFRLAKKQGVSTVIDTSGEPFTREEPQFSKFQKMLELTDLLLLDLKHMDDKAHKELTGKSNASILAFARYLAEIHKPVWIRHVLVPGVTDSAVNLQNTSRFIASLGNVERVEVLPYHRMAIHKYEELGIPYRFKDIKEPTAAEVRRAETILQVDKYQGYKK